MRQTLKTSWGSLVAVFRQGKLNRLGFGKGDCDAFEDCAKNLELQLEEYFTGKRKSFDIQIDPDGTDFQKAIWNACREIPYGSVIAYSGLAAKIGRPNSQRACGSALNKNPIHIVVPCHRVVAKHGIGGFGGMPGDLTMKIRLLELEKPGISSNLHQIS